MSTYTFISTLGMVFMTVVAICAIVISAERYDERQERKKRLIGKIKGSGQKTPKPAPWPID